ncbi:hypothetical protein CWE04_11275 [Thomasclavelia cocleata]|uniref:Uncharacterized protein n=1 Tax=Thomasclavelia cocleata TaxID=69824 RepID=A0A1I0BF14_9FIRM|nr:hypothetical protein [Thomasclavelia cocleata]MCR1959891.1 hypothetical protein [Thomasclavelia cocleata]NDO41763.1 hypothetical protein [Thomasclavelia cocleata]PJN79790.1 hypothetical protein CWE04_11275 [Thomasclavelia cocleata]SET05549.1 hypothetical protein SAMN04489758_101102 [Thomasclavelia cocleata]
MNPETKLQNEIMVKMSELGCIPMRRNVGLFYTQNMIPIHIGTEGEPDIEIICPNGKVLWYEIVYAEFEYCPKCGQAIDLDGCDGK